MLFMFLCDLPLFEIESWRGCFLFHYQLLCLSICGLGDIFAAHCFRCFVIDNLDVWRLVSKKRFEKSVDIVIRDQRSRFVFHARAVLQLQRLEFPTLGGRVVELVLGRDQMFDVRRPLRHVPPRSSVRRV